MNTSTGRISGTPTAAATSTVTLGATNAAGTGNKTLTLTVNPAKPVISSAGTASGQTGVAFSYQITASNSPTSFSASGLPAGLSVNTSTGLISGTPTAVATSTVTLGATNAGGTGNKTLTLTVTLGKPVITSAATATGQVGVTFSYQITASNSPTSFSATGLPAGLSVNTSTGRISGTPTTAATSTVTLGATNAGGTGNATLTLTVNPAKPVISSAGTASGQNGGAFSYQITASNNPTSFSATGLPAGLSINITTGLISGTPTAVATSTLTLGATNAGGTGNKTLTLTVTLGKPVITSALTATGQIGVAFSYQITASNLPTSFSATGLPAGLSVSTSTGLISGTPTAAAASTVTLGATNAAGTGNATLTLTINPAKPVISSATTATGKVGTAFNYQIVASNSPTTYGATPLPAGLSIDTATGLITGTPTAVGTSTVTISATNAGGTASSTLTITILAVLPYTADFETAEGYVLGALTGQFGWTVPQGTAFVTTQDFSSGGQAVQLPAGNPRSLVSQTFGSEAGEGIIFFDFFAKPVAGPNPDLVTTFTVEQARFAFKQAGALGTLQVLNGDGGGSGTWTPTAFTIPLGANNQAQTWHRLTARLDFSLNTWDVYANGQMVAADVATMAGSSYLSSFQVLGDTSAPTGLDYIYAGPANPVFTDANNNGIDDAWETLHGLSLSTNNRNLSPSGSGVTVIQAYVNGTDPNDFFNGTVPTLTILGGNNQVAPAGQFNPQPFDIGVWNTAGTAPLVNAPVSFTVQSGGGKLALANTGNPALLTTLNLTTDVNGTAQVYYLQPPATATPSVVKFTAGLGQAIFNTASATNVDSDQNGLADSWEVQHFGHTGVPPAADPDSDQLTNLQEFTLGTDPNAVDTDGDVVNDGLEVSLGMNPLLADAETLPGKIGGLKLFLRADAGVIVDGSGNVSAWQDQSGHAYDATQAGAGNRPALVSSVINGQPVVRFNGTNSFLALPQFLGTAASAELFVVLRTSSATNSDARLFSYFGSSDSTSYPVSPGVIRDGFGASTTNEFSPAGADLTQAHAYNVSAASGSWTARLDGAVLSSIAPNTPNFANSVYPPTIGTAHTGNYGALASWFGGDVAEIIIYDHALTTAERQAVGGYLKNKFNLAIASATVPANFTATALTSTRVGLSWSGASSQTYTVERSATANNWQVITNLNGQTSFMDTGLTPSTTYSYRVKAGNYAGVSAYAGPVSATTLDSDDLPLSGMKLWLKPESLVQSSDGLSLWVDQSGSGNDAVQAGPANRPQVVAGVINGQPVVRFNGTNSFLALPQFLGTAASAELFVVLRTSSATNSDARLFSYFGSSDSTSYPVSPGVIRDGFGASTTNEFSPAGADLTQAHAYNVSAASGSWTARLDGAVLSSIAPNTPNFANSVYPPTIGTAHTGNFGALASWFGGDVAEIIIYDHALTTAERLTVTRMLNSKYNLGIAGPAVPTNFAAVALSPTKVALTWTGGSGQSYQIERSNGGGAWQAVATLGGTTSFTDAGLTGATAYNYRIKATNAGGSSNFVGPVVATTPGGDVSELTSGMKLWLKPESLVQSPDGLSLWADQSGSGNDAVQAGPANRPQVVAGVINGQPVVRFNGTNSFLALPKFLGTATSAELFVVLRSSSATNSDARLFSYFGSGDSTYYPGSPGVIQDGFGSSTTNTFSPAGADLTQPHFYNVSAAGGSWTARLDGAVLSTSAANTPNFADSVYPPTIGTAHTGNYGALASWFGGDVAEIIIYDRALTAAERETVNHYLNQRYNLSTQPFNDLSSFNYDSDGDGLSNTQEQTLGTSLYNRDTDGDGLPDDWEVDHELDPLNSIDGTLDPDSDGLGNLGEYLAGTNPLVPVANDAGASVKLKIFQPATR